MDVPTYLRLRALVLGGTPNNGRSEVRRAHYSKKSTSQQVTLEKHFGSSTMAHGAHFMLKKRIIPCLDVDDGRVVKGVRFVSLRDAGDPVAQARAYDEAGADELVFLDISASHEGRATMRDVVSRVAACCFMPLTVGGGVSQVSDVRALLLAGADKVAMNSAAVANPALIGEASAKFGAQCIVVGGGCQT